MMNNEHRNSCVILFIFIEDLFRNELSGIEPVNYSLPPERLRECSVTAQYHFIDLSGHQKRLKLIEELHRGKYFEGGFAHLKLVT